MARKKTEKKMPVAAEVETKPVRLDLSPEVHQMLRIVAAKEGKSMSVWAREWVEREVRRREGK